MTAGAPFLCSQHQRPHGITAKCLLAQPITPMTWAHQKNKASALTALTVVPRIGDHSLEEVDAMRPGGDCVQNSVWAWVYVPIR
jgi:hypothetical protein